MSEPQEPKTGTEPSPSDRPNHPYGLLEAGPDLLRLRDAERMDWIVDNYCSVGGGNGFEVKFWIPLDTECLRSGIDFCIANAVTAAKPLGNPAVPVPCESLPEAE